MTEPIRTCLGCRSRQSSRGMVRVARTADGRCSPGRTAPGRGAWVCSEHCFDLATRTRRWAHALRGVVPTHTFEAVRATLFADFEAN